MRTALTSGGLPKGTGWCPGSRRRCRSRRRSAGAVRPLPRPPPRPQSAQSPMHLRQQKHNVSHISNNMNHTTPHDLILEETTFSKKHLKTILQM